jgi:hypothetical protein
VVVCGIWRVSGVCGELGTPFAARLPPKVHYQTSTHPYHSLTSFVLYQLPELALL